MKKQKLENPTHTLFKVRQLLLKGDIGPAIDFTPLRKLQVYTNMQLDNGEDTSFWWEATVVGRTTSFFHQVSSIKSLLAS